MNIELHLMIGTVLGDEEHGAFCGGWFGRDSYSVKRVEAIGADWVVVRNEEGEAEFACDPRIHEVLALYIRKPA